MAKILTVSQGGLVTLVFSQPLNIPDNYTLLDGEQLELTFAPELTEFKWKVKSFQLTFMTIQVDF
jgi:hypothetical protein